MKKVYFFIFLILTAVFLNSKIGWEAKRYFLKDFSKDDFSLEKENLILKAQISQFEILKPFLNKNLDYKVGFIYSRYPFNFKNEILVNLGEKDGIQPDSAVVIPSSLTSQSFILVGKIKDVYENFSTIQTLFDSNFKLTVQIANSEEALLVGGPLPKITLIPIKNEINTGDVVFSKDSTLPYGLIIGGIKKIQNVSNSLFLEAKIELPYDLSQINAVAILKK